MSNASATEPAPATNCFACGRSMDQIREEPRHSPEPKFDGDRCGSRPRKYTQLRCRYAIGHECLHTADVPGTGRHFWSDAESLKPLQ